MDPNRVKYVIVCIDAHRAMQHAAKKSWKPDDWLLVQSIADAQRHGPIDDPFVEITILGRSIHRLAEILEVLTFGGDNAPASMGHTRLPG